MTCGKMTGFLFRYLKPQIENMSVNNSHRTQILGKTFNGFKSYSTKKLSPSEKMAEVLRDKFPLAKQIEVTDVSANCGSMYEIIVESVEFKGLSMVKQHRMINEILKKEIRLMHGVRIQTSVPEGKS